MKSRITGLFLALVLVFAALTMTAQADTQHSCADSSTCRVCTLAEMINDLPAADDITIANAAAVTEQIHAIDRLKYELVIDEDAGVDEYTELLTLVESVPPASGYGADVPKRYVEAVEKIKSLGTGASFLVQKTVVANGSVDVSNAQVQVKLTNVSTGSSQTLTLATMPMQTGTLSADSDYYTYNGSGWTYCYKVPAGTYTLVETAHGGATVNGQELTGTPVVTYYVNGEPISASEPFTVAEGSVCQFAFGNTYNPTLYSVNTVDYVENAVVKDNDNVSTDGDSVNSVEEGKDYTVVITPNSGYYFATAPSVTLANSGDTVSFTYENGLLTVSAAGINGNLVLTAKAVPIPFAVTQGGTTTYYHTLNDALWANRNADDITITLQSDVGQDDMGDDSWFDIDKNITLNLSGYTMTHENWCLFKIAAGGTLTVNGSSGGKITASRGIFDMTGGTLVINGGTYENTNDGGNVLSMSAYDNATNAVITGGTFAGGIQQNESPGLQSITITGGTFQGDIRLRGTNTISGSPTLPTSATLTVDQGTLDLSGYNGVLVNQKLEITSGLARNAITLPPGYGFKRTLTAEYPLLYDEAFDNDNNRRYYIDKIWDITFDYDGVEDKADVLIPVLQSNGLLKKTPDLQVPNGYTGSWYTAQDGGNAVVADHEFNGPATVYARRTANTYIITLHFNGGKMGDSEESSTTVEWRYDGNDFPLPTRYDINRNYHECIGWAQDKNAVVPEFRNTIPADKAGALTLYAVWEPRTYPYELNANGGTMNIGGQQGLESYDGEFVYGTSVTFPSDVTRRGYKFLGWDDGSPEPVFGVAVGEVVSPIYYAMWEPVIYKITYELNGGVNDPYNPTTYSVEDWPTIAEPTREGYDFVGWECSELTSAATRALADLSALGDTYLGDVTLVAVWTPADGTEYNVAHWLQNLDDPEKYTRNEATTLMHGVTGEKTQAYAEMFDGFTAQEFEQGVIAADGSTVIHIKYTRNSYTATFNFGNGEEPVQMDLRYEEELPEVKDPERAGYIFAGWTPYLHTSMPAQDMTYTALWTPADGTAYKVEHYFRLPTSGDYELDAAKTQTLTGKTGEQTAASALNVEGFTAEPFTQETISGDGTTVVKIYYKRNVYKVEINIGDTNGDGEDDIITIPDAEYGAEITEPETPTKSGFIFDGWVDENGDPVDFPMTVPEGGITIYPTWKPENATAYTVEHHFQKLGGTEYVIDASKTQTLYGNAGMETKAVALTVEGFTAQTITQATIASDNTTKVIVKYDRKKVTVTINPGDTNGDGKDDIITIPDAEYGAEITEPETPTKPGSIFDGWVDENGDPVDFPMTVPEGGITIYPTWKPEADGLPIFTVPTAGQTISVYEGDTATMTVATAEAAAYQWYINRNDGLGFVQLQGATGATYTTGVLTQECSGYTYRCDATNGVGTARSPIFQLQVSKTAELPATGDSGQAGLWLLMAAMALLSMSVLTVRMRRN